MEIVQGKLGGVEEHWNGSLKARVKWVFWFPPVLFSASRPLWVLVSSSEQGRARATIQAPTYLCWSLPLPGSHEAHRRPRDAILCVAWGNLLECPELEITHLSLGPACMVLLLTCSKTQSKLLVWGADSTRTLNSVHGSEVCSKCKLVPGFSAGNPCASYPSPCLRLVLHVFPMSSFRNENLATPHPVLFPPISSWFVFWHPNSICHSWASASCSDFLPFTAHDYPEFWVFQVFKSPFI